MSDTEIDQRVGLRVETAQSQDMPPLAPAHPPEAPKPEPQPEVERLRSLVKGLGEDWFSSAVRNVRKQNQIVGQRLDRIHKLRGGKGRSSDPK